MTYMRNGLVYTGDDPNTALLLVTGQTTQYSGELDDGYYEAGEAKNYEILTTGQHAGACVFVLNGKTENQSHECVRDLRTGKMWARYTSAQSASVGPASDGKMPWTGTDDDIFQYAAAANVAELGGYLDWRVANRAELMSLVDSEAPNGGPDGTAFPSSWTVSSAAGIWSSTTNPNSTGHALYVRFRYGILDTDAKAVASWASLVRGGI